MQELKLRLKKVLQKWYKGIFVILYQSENALLIEFKNNGKKFILFVNIHNDIFFNSIIDKDGLMQYSKESDFNQEVGLLSTIIAEQISE